MEYIKSANLKGNVEIMGEGEFLWNLGGVFCDFLLAIEKPQLYIHDVKVNFLKSDISMKILAT